MPLLHTIKKYLYTLILLFITLWLASCDSSRVYDQVSRIKDGEWKQKEPLTFEFSIKDSTALYNVYVQVRNTTNYAYSNLYLFLFTRDAYGKMNRDTIECVLANAEGKWLGKGLGKLKDNRILIKKGMRWAAGTYQVQIEQAMRKEVLQGISDVGLRIEKE